MFSATPSNLVFINQLGPCRFHSWKPTNQNLNKCLMKVKEKAKLTNYYGFHIQRLPEREAIYAPLGGPNRGRHYVRQSKSGKNFEHHNARHGNVHTHYHQRFKNPHNTPHGITLWIWTSQWGVNEPGWGYSNFGVQHNGDRNSTVRNLESWGMKVVNVDDRTAPRVENLMPHKHKLYQQNFPWIKEPETNQKYGDVDYNWKYDDKFDYSSNVAVSANKQGTTFANPSAGGVASYEHSVMASVEEAVAKSRGTYVAPVQQQTISSTQQQQPSSASTAKPAAAAEAKSEKKVEEKKAAAPATEEKKAAAPAAAEEKKAAPAAAPAATEEKEAPAKKSKKSSKKDKDSE